MKWERGHQSANVEDRRGQRGGRRPLQIGLVGILVLLGLSALLGRDLLTPLLSGGALPGPADPSGAAPPAVADEQVQFVSFVLDDNQSTWRQLFAQSGQSYPDARLVIFSSAVDTACSPADSGVGPFYCPGDQHVYIDLSFYDQMKRQLGAPGDFAQAYVIAHEVGHHIQNILGASDRVHAARGRVSQSEYNRLSVRLELQADFYAGVWAHHAQQLRSMLEPGDLEEAMNAAHQIGDDTLQKQGQGRVVPDSFTHGSAAQRMAWFKRGFETGDMRKGDTFDDAVFNSVAPR